MAEFSVNPTRFDPYKNFKFRIKWDGRYVAGISKISGLRRTTEVIQHREGGDPSSSRKSPGRTEYAPVTLERGVTHDPEFENWANKVWRFGAGLGAEVSLKDFRKDILPSISTTRRGNLFCLTKSTAVGSLNTRYCRIWMPMRTPLPSSSSNWKMKAGSATTRLRNQPSRSFKKPNSAPSLFDRRENIRDNFAA